MYIFIFLKFKQFRNFPSTGSNFKNFFVLLLLVTFCHTNKEDVHQHEGIGDVAV